MSYFSLAYIRIVNMCTHMCNLPFWETKLEIKITYHKHVKYQMDLVTQTSY